MPDLAKSIGEIFSNRSFQIPDYQRGYAWKDKQWNDLWQDLELLPLKRDHFTGTLVLKPVGNPPEIWTDQRGEDHYIFDVIDGQQRLTTLVILLKVILDHFIILDADTDLIKGIRENYLFCKCNKIDIALLTPGRDSKDFFLNHILMDKLDLHGKTNRSEKNLADAKVYFAAKINEKKTALGSDFSQWLNNFRDKITRQLKLIVYEVADELDAGIIFETMNDRGKPLTELDKVKNYLLYICSNLMVSDPERINLTHRINATWTSIFEELMAAQLSDEIYEDQLLRVHWLMAYDYNANKWAQSRSIKEKFNLNTYKGPHSDLLKDILLYLESLQNTVTAYCDLIMPLRTGAFNEVQDEQRKREIVFLSSKLARLGARAGFLPLLIAVRLMAGDNGESYKQVVDLCEKFDFRVYEWSHMQPRAGQPALFRIGYDFYKNSNLEELMIGIRQLLWDNCPDTRFLQRFENETENWYNWGGLKYYLYEYEQFSADQAGKPVQMPWELLSRSRKEDTIEHILPQTPVDPYWTKRFLDVERERWTHDIGNLTLTYDNSPMSNKPFRLGLTNHDDKISYYADSKLFIEQCLKNVVDWNVAAIQDRRNKIKTWSIERWAVTPMPRPVISRNTEQAQLSADERKAHTLQTYLDQADQLGNGKEFRLMLEALQKLPGYISLNSTHYGPSLRPKGHGLNWMIYIYPSLNVDFSFWVFEDYFRITEAEMIEIFGSNHLTHPREQIPDFIERVERLNSLIRVKTTN
jgi:hypothetical protein